MNPAELKSMRKRAGMTQQLLAEHLDISRVYLGLMERGLAPIERRTELAVRYLLERRAT
ncbi:MAG: helix-turn-helix domain-containing protein [Pigmentiphaga sp.]